MVDVLGLLICIVVHAANIQDREGGKRVLAKAAGKGLPRLKKVLADDGYSGQPMVEHVRLEHGWEFESVKRTELPKSVCGNLVKILILGVLMNCVILPRL